MTQKHVSCVFPLALSGTLDTCVLKVFVVYAQPIWKAVSLSVFVHVGD